MSDTPPVDGGWLNDRSEFQMNFVHGLLNPAGLRLQYALEADHVVAGWTPGAEHVGFPGIVHGGLIGAILDDIMGRCSVLQRRWVVTARLETRYRQGAVIGQALRAEAWATRFTRRVMLAEGRITAADGSVIAEGAGSYLPVPAPMLERMVQTWPGFRAFLTEPPA